MYLLPDSTTVPVFAFRNFLRPARQEVITLNIHRLRKGGAEESLIVPLTEIRPFRVISLPESLASLESLPIRVHFASIFNSLRKREREREREEKQEEGERKGVGQNRFFAPSPLVLTCTYTQFYSRPPGRYRAGSRNSPRYRFKYSYVGLKNGRNTIYYSYPYLRRYSSGSGLYARFVHPLFKESWRSRASSVRTKTKERDGTILRV